MVLKRLVGSGKAPVTNTKNEAGGRAYAFSPEHALAQYAVTGTMHNTFYATGGDQLDTILALAAKVSPDFVAKTAVYCRERGFMKDVPALLVAYLAKNDVGLMKAVFPRVVDNGKMLRNFVQIVRSGAVGRKSFGYGAEAGRAGLVLEPHAGDDLPQRPRRAAVDGGRHQDGPAGAEDGRRPEGRGP
jgi:hypothetical protein